MAKETRRYAEGTSVPADKSRHELEALLEKHGATEFAIHRDATRTTILYRMRGRMVRQVIEYPSADRFKRRPQGGYRSTSEIAQAQASEWRRLWRAHLLITKAKLEIIASGGSTFEREFLADTLLPNGETVEEALLPRIAEAYKTGQMPKLLLGSGD